MTNEEKKKVEAAAKEKIKQKICDKIKEVQEEITDGVLSLIPVEVAEHLGNAKKELLMAARSMIDREINKVDECIDRAKEVHRKK